MTARAKNTHQRLVATLVFTFFLLALIALSLGNTNPGIAIAAGVSAMILASVFHFVLPGSKFFTAVFANSIGIYACVFVFFIEQNFPGAGPHAQEAAFVMPLVGFLGGVLWQRRRIAKAVEAGEAGLTGEQLLGRIFWMMPSLLVAIASFVLPIREAAAGEQALALFIAMGIIALTVLLSARDIAAFIVSTAILSEDFFANAARLARPAFAFFTVYSLLVLIYGCLYTIIGRVSDIPNFDVGGVPRSLSFGEGLYLSVVTLSTVGYGDFLARTPVARLLVGSEIFLGVLLLLFGLQAILSQDRKL